MLKKKKILTGVGLLGVSALIGGVSIFLHSRHSKPIGAACLIGKSAVTHSCGPFSPELVTACAATKSPQCRQGAWERSLIVSLVRSLPAPHDNCLQPGEEPWIWACGPFDSAFAEICRTKIGAGDICTTNRWHRELLARTMAAAFPAPLRPGLRPILVLRGEKEKWSLALVSELKTLEEIPVEVSTQALPHEGLWWVLGSHNATNGLLWDNGIGNLNAQPNGVSLPLIQLSTKGLKARTSIGTGISPSGINIVDLAAQRTFISWFSDPGASPRAFWTKRGKQRDPSPLEQRTMRDAPATLQTRN